MKKSISVILALLLAVLLFTCINRTDNINDPRGEMFAGAASCIQCHQAVYKSFAATTHFNSTVPATSENIYGSFSNGQNSFSYNDSTKIVMEHRDSGFFQVLYENGKEKEAHRFDITFGKKHAQTFLSWKNSKTFELPVSFYSNVKGWVSSPGFSSQKVNFNRFIGEKCFECHTSNVDSKLNPTANGMEELLDKNSLVYGIDCERCHGPAANHINFHLANPGVKEAKYIVLIKTLDHQQKLDMCAVCHSGNDKEKERSTFHFRPGQYFADYFSPYTVGRTKNNDFDVHGNQYQLLSLSKCFLNSKTLTCTTCHDPHSNADDNLATYSAKCISCHQTTDHSPQTKAQNAGVINTNCIDCHMLKQLSQAISFQLQADTQRASYLLRTHKIAVYSRRD